MNELVDRWRVRVPPGAVREEPAVISGLVSRVAPIEVTGEALARAAAAIGVEGVPEFDGEDEWVVTDPRGYKLAFGAGPDPRIPRLAGRLDQRMGPPAGWPALEPVGAWQPDGDEGERFASAVALVERIGILHRSWVAPPRSEWGRGIWLRPLVDGVVMGNVGRGDPEFWHFLTAKKHPTTPGLDNLSGQMANIEPFTELPLHGAWASLDATLAGRDGRAEMISGSMIPDVERWVEGVHVELAERRYRGLDGQVTVYLVPFYVFTGSLAAPDGPLEPFAGNPTWPSLGGLIALPAVDFEPPEPSVPV